LKKKPGLGAKFVRAAGSSAFLVSKEGYYNFLKMNSGWILKISNYCVVILGMISNIDNNVIRIKNAGYNRRLGIRPRVRGVAMNPCDHPHGGGEGTGSPPRAHKTPWGKLAKVPTKRKKKFLIKKNYLKKMGRSLYKTKFLQRAQFNKYLYNNDKRVLRKYCFERMVNSKISVQPFFFFWNRASVINRKLLNKKICVYNGKVFHILNINKNFLGYRLGSFSFTRKKPSHINKKRQVKKIKFGKNLKKRKKNQIDFI